jgi:hypothetical protein
MTKNKTHIQCGYELECKKKDCIKCAKNRIKVTLCLSQAEQIAIEDCAMIDLAVMQTEKPEVLDLVQRIMRKVMKKMFIEERKLERDAESRKKKVTTR